MAAKRSAPCNLEELFCITCNKQFLYRSKYSRHLETEGHLRFSRMLALADDIQESYDDVLHDPEVDSQDSLSHAPTCTRTIQDPDGVLECNEEVYISDDNLDEAGEVSDFSVDSALELLNNTDGDYYPFESKVQVLAFMLTNGPRPMGEANLGFVFHVLKEMNSSAPSLSSIKQLQLPGFVEPTKHYSVNGVPFYMNSPSTIIRKCIGTPGIAQAVARFPVMPKREMREIFHGNHWMTNSRFTTPMVNSPVGHIFVDDFIDCNIEGKLVTAKVTNFFMKEEVDTPFMKVVPLHKKENLYLIGSEATTSINDVVSLTSSPSQIHKWNSSTSSVEQLSQNELVSFIATNNLKKVASGRQVVQLPLILFTDDTSGNKSKQWNKFDSWCLKLAGLPNHENSKLTNIHLICCSNKCSVLDMCKPMAEDLCKLETEGIIAYDASLKEEVLVFSPVLCITADNPRHSEIMNHSGSSANMFCRFCMADKRNFKTEISELRSKENTMDIIQAINSKRTEKEKQVLRKNYGVTISSNPLLEIPIDLHRSTPVETLHTILLGPYKYFLRRLIARLSTRQKEEIQSILSGFNFSGFKANLVSRLFRYHKSFVGRDFKSLAQCSLFIFRKYFSQDEKKAWLALSKVFKLAYCEHFVECNQERYKEICKHFVDTTSECFPDFRVKVKIHLMLHLVDCMVEFGPTCAYNTERCEAFNSLLRARNIFSNRLSPSRDIIRDFAVIDYLRSVCTGGQCDKDRSVGRDLQALYTLPGIQSFLNGTPAKELFFNKGIYQPGSLRKLITKNQILGGLTISVREFGHLTLNQVKEESRLTLVCSNIELTSTVDVYGCTMSKRSMLIRVGDYVQYFDGTSDMDQCFGLLLACFSGHCLVQILQPMDVLGEPICNEYDCPILCLSNLIYCISSQCISYAVSIVHECSDSCKFVSSVSKRQIEHESVTVPQLIFCHDWSNKIYCHNLYCMITS